MKLAILGSRSIDSCDLESYVPTTVTEIVSGGARGVDRLAADYAGTHGIPLIEFLPDYARYGKGAPLKRNEKIAEYAEEALVFWDGHSKGTEHVIELLLKKGKRITIICRK